jgi:hypothetical protein
MIEKIPENQQEFDRIFSTESPCISYIIKNRWPEGPICAIMINSGCVEPYWSVQPVEPRCVFSLEPSFKIHILNLQSGLKLSGLWSAKNLELTPWGSIEL